MSRQTPGYSSGALSIDPLRPEDLPVFRELLGELVDVLDMRDVYAVEDDALCQAMFSEPPQVEAIIARYNGEPAGLATWTLGFHLVRGKTVMSFEYIYVRPEFRRHFITVAMLVYILVLAKRRGYFRIEGFVHDWNSETAGFYKGLKAVEVPQKAYRLDLSEVDWAPFRRFLEIQPPDPAV